MRTVAVGSRCALGGRRLARVIALVRRRPPACVTRVVSPVSSRALPGSLRRKPRALPAAIADPLAALRSSVIVAASALARLPLPPAIALLSVISVIPCRRWCARRPVVPLVRSALRDRSNAS